MSAPNLEKYGLEQVDEHTYQVPGQGNPTVSIDGYKILGLPYPDAAAFWSEELASQPGYKPAPPVTEVSADTEVSGEV